MFRNRGCVEGAITAPGPCVVRVRCSSSDGRLVVERRVRDLSYSLRLEPGTYEIEFSDERDLDDPRRFAPAVVEVEVRVGATLVTPVRLERGAILTGEVYAAGAAARFARVSLTGEDGQLVAVRTDGNGGFVVAGLTRQIWSVDAQDHRRDWCSRPVAAGLASSPIGHARLDLDTPTGAVLVELRSTGGGQVPADKVSAVDRETGSLREAAVHGELAVIKGLRPGAYDVVVPPSAGHLGTRQQVSVETELVSACRLIVDCGATIRGQVTQHDAAEGVLAALVTLHDAEGATLDRVRTDSDGNFVLGRGLAAAEGLGVVVSSGPEHLTVVRACVSELAVGDGEQLDIGRIQLPTGARGIVWAPRYAVPPATMKLPTTRV